jgi:polyisoprenoid-binding protein YceI
MRVFWIVLILVIIALGFYFLRDKNSSLANVKSIEVEEEQEKNMEEIKSIYNLDTERSTLDWTASKIVSTTHTGKVALKSGIIQKGENNFLGGSFVIDMTKITESKDNEQFLGHIRSDDFFAIEKFPESRFEITSIENVEGNTYKVAGDLTIKDKTNTIDFSATLEDDENELKVSAEFNIDRTRWGVNFDSGTVFQQLGDKAIKDEIEYKLNLILTRS